MFSIGNTFGISLGIVKKSNLLIIKKNENLSNILWSIDGIRNGEWRSNSAIGCWCAKIDLYIGIWFFISTWTHLDRHLDKYIIKCIGNSTGSYSSHRYTTRHKCCRLIPPLSNFCKIHTIRHKGVRNNQVSIFHITRYSIRTNKSVTHTIKSNRRSSIV